MSPSENSTSSVGVAAALQLARTIATKMTATVSKVHLLVIV